MSAWPPPPDLASIRELVRDADTEEFIANGSPADEYDTEAESLFGLIGCWSTSQLTVPNLTPIIEQIWRKSFAYDDVALDLSRPVLVGLAQQIARFFGPEAQPQTRRAVSSS